MIYSALEVAGGLAAAGVFKVTHEAGSEFQIFQTLLTGSEKFIDVQICSALFNDLSASNFIFNVSARWRPCLKEKTWKPEGSAPDSRLMEGCRVKSCVDF